MEREHRKARSELMSRIRVLIVDDHIVVRQGLRSMLADARDVEVVGEAANAIDAIKRITELSPDVLLLDIRMPGMDGIRLLRDLRHRVPELKVIILTNYADEQFLLGAFQAGAYGYLLKNVGRSELLDALRNAYGGKRLLSPELMDSALRQLVELGQYQVMDRFNLSEKEIRLLELVAEGASNRQIAEQLYWSESTVKRKLSDVFEKLDVSDRIQAVTVAVRHGLI